MGKGTRTREAILEKAVDLASVAGLDGVTIGALATQTGLSKSGLFAHFGSKENLEVETLRAAAVELDDQEGTARDYLVVKQRQWIDTIARAAQRAVEVGDFRDDTDAEQFAYDLYSVFLGYHHARRLLRDPHAETRARNAFETLMQNAR